MLGLNMFFENDFNVPRQVHSNWWGVLGVSGGRRRCRGEDRGRGRSGGWSGRVEECRSGVGDGVFWGVSKLFTLLCQIPLPWFVRWDPITCTVAHTLHKLFAVFFFEKKKFFRSGSNRQECEVPRDSCIPRHLIMVPFPTVGWSVTRSGWRGRGVAVTRRARGMCGRAKQHGKSV